MKNVLLSAGLFLCLNMYSQKKIEPKLRDFTSVELNSVVSSEIGDKLIEKGIEKFSGGIKIVSFPLEKKYAGHEFNIDNGDVLRLYGTYKQYKLYYDKNLPVSTTSFQGIAVENDDYSRPKLFVQGLRIKILEESPQLNIKETIYTENCSECFRKELVFNGKSGNQLKFIYREYINDMARPAFNQELQYDLTESNTIGFKGLRLEVEKATNTNIEYKVLSGFSDM